jgi:hypothetical protein
VRNDQVRNLLRNPQSPIRNLRVGWEATRVTAVHEPNAFLEKEGGPKTQNGGQSNNG